MTGVLYKWVYDGPKEYQIERRWEKQLDIRGRWKSRIRTAQIGTEYFETIEAARDAEQRRLEHEIDLRQKHIDSLRNRLEKVKAAR